VVEVEAAEEEVVVAVSCGCSSLNTLPSRNMTDMIQVVAVPDRDNS
jgi:hypothetical protein